MMTWHALQPKWSIIYLRPTCHRVCSQCRNNWTHHISTDMHFFFYNFLSCKANRRETRGPSNIQPQNPWSARLKIEANQRIKVRIDRTTDGFLCRWTSRVVLRRQVKLRLRKRGSEIHLSFEKSTLALSTNCRRKSRGRRAWKGDELTESEEAQEKRNLEQA